MFVDQFFVLVEIDWPNEIREIGTLRMEVGSLLFNFFPAFTEREGIVLQE